MRYFVAMLALLASALPAHEPSGVDRRKVAVDMRMIGVCDWWLPYKAQGRDTDVAPGYRRAWDHACVDYFTAEL